VIGGRETVLHLVPSGSSERASTGYIGNGVVLSPQGAVSGDGRAGSRRRGNRRTLAHFGGLSTDIFLHAALDVRGNLRKAVAKIGTTGRRPGKSTGVRGKIGAPR